MSAKSEKTPVADEAAERLDALTLLQADHKQVRKLFKEFTQLSGGNSHAAKADVAQRLCETWILHAALEQEILYPAAREAMADDEALINELEVHYTGMCELIARIQQMDGSEPLYDATVAVLQQYVESHIDEEEKQLFPKARKAKMHLHKLGQIMAQRREERTVELA
ncbi:MAG TPA: hemerythrin domain-containing protein [Oxalicibacterium sp.]|jgi:hemerythrin-like domain-containing protein|nr:hemerythrin domain-containing protein [Oxalicibacterium sp.]